MRYFCHFKVTSRRLFDPFWASFRCENIPQHKLPVSFYLESLQGSNFQPILNHFFGGKKITFFENIPQLKTPVSFNLEGLEGSNFWPILISRRLFANILEDFQITFGRPMGHFITFRPLLDDFLTTFVQLFDRFLAPCGTLFVTFRSFLDDFLTTFGRLLDHFWAPRGTLFVTFRPLLDDFLTTFRRLLDHF